MSDQSVSCVSFGLEYIFTKQKILFWGWYEKMTSLSHISCFVTTDTSFNIIYADLSYFGTVIIYEI